MSANCRKITFEMQEDENVWDSVFPCENVTEMTLTQSFLPETLEEEIIIRIVRRTRQTEQYASYLKDLSDYRL